MALTKGQLTTVPGGPGTTGTVKAGVNCAIAADGSLNAVTGVAPVSNISAGSNCSVTSNANIYTITATNIPAGGGFPRGTTTVFPQPSAPTGWSVNSSVDNSALRISSSGGNSSGSDGFTVAFSNKTLNGSANLSYSVGGGFASRTLTPTGNIDNAGWVSGGTVLSQNQLPSHTHVAPNVLSSGGDQKLSQNGPFGPADVVTTGFTGGSQAHTHGLAGGATFSGKAQTHGHDLNLSGSIPAPISANAINLSIKYVDALICTKS